MKKRILTWLLAISMLGSLLTVPAGAAAVTKFSDVSDSYTATAVESLRLMGVLDGYGDGTFRPDTVLNRAQFCKMAVYAMDGSGELGRYSTVTIFPDVKPSHWASAYINMAARKGIISGFADGKFKPGQTVTAGQAVTILMRGLGYKDEDMGGVWPQSYMAEAQTNGLLKSTGITSAYAGLTRAQAAKLFLNLFEAKHGKGETLLFNYNVGKDEVYLTAVDGGKGTMTISGNGTSKTYTMAHPVTSTSLIGSKGKAVLNSADEILTFLPITGSNGVSNAAVIIGANGSVAGLDSLAGSTSYNIYKNGSPATAADLKRYDVATYASATNSIIVSDTRVSVYYEDCKPSPSSPATITVLGGKELNVLPTAVDSLSKLKPGKQIVLLLTADGQVAGAEDANNTGARGNAMAVVSEKGDVQLVCGGALLNIGTASEYAGQVVSVYADKSGLKLNKISGGVGGDLLPKEGTLGGRKLADNVMLFDGGRQIALSELSQTGVNSGRVSYARTNWAGQVDLIVLNNGLAEDVIYGRAVVNSSTSKVWVWDPGHENDKEQQEGVNGSYKETTSQTISIETANKTYGPINSGNHISNGTFVAVSIKTSSQGNLMFTSFAAMSKLSNVSSSAWIGKTAVNFGSRTYEVPSNVQCYNDDTGKWMTLDDAKAYGGTMNLYVYDGVVRIVEVKA
ncbi:S-layer homology domain-containing protein [Dysosmobacter sp.]|uniref:S-layer homology domain-containing protein n=1 Tax=Dysosmobacter sp. TaxID=2591382 RepID=UPI003AB2C0F7